MQEATREFQVCLPRRRGVCEPSLTLLYLPRVSKEALRSIIISQRLLGTREIAVFHHTGCGMLTFDTPQLRKLVKDSDPSNPALSAVDEIDFHEFNGLEESIKADVKFLEENPLVLPGTKITGWVYEVETGKVSFGLYDAIVASCSRDVVEERGAYSCPTDKTGCVIQLTLF